MTIISSKNLILKITLFLALIVIVVLPFYAAHAAAPLVPCGREGQPMCTFCDSFVLIKNVIDFLLVDILTPVGVLFIVYAGILILTGGYKPGNIAQGKKVLTDTILGIFIIFSAWMITNTILQLFTGNNNISTHWYSISCNVDSGTNIGGPTPTPVPTTGGNTITCAPVSGKIAKCTNCKPVQYGSTRNQTINGSRVDQVAGSLADFLNNRLSPALQAAGISPPYYNDGICPNSLHQSPAHYTGHAMDINGKDMATTNKICGILNNLGVRKHEPGTGYLGNSTNVYIVESRSCKGILPNCNCPGNSPGGSGIHVQY